MLFSKKRLLVLLISATVLGAAGQDEHHSRHQVAAGGGFTFIPVAGGLADTEARGLFVPTVGLDYFLHLAKRWEIGIMADYELDHYMIVDNQIEREHALLITLAGMFKITPHWGIFTGGGVELEPHHHLAVFRLGGEYTIDLRNNWIILPRLYFDFKESYNTWSFAVTFGKRF